MNFDYNLKRDYKILKVFITFLKIAFWSIPYCLAYAFHHSAGNWLLMFLMVDAVFIWVCVVSLCWLLDINICDKKLQQMKEYIEKTPEPLVFKGKKM